jgi:dTDP-4-dehydrorhamnose reductase
VWVQAHPAPRRRWAAAADAPRPILITGATGTLGRHFARACEHRGLAYVLTDRSELDLASEESIAAALDGIDPWAVVNAAGWVRVEEAERRVADCMEANAKGVERLAAACAARDLPLMSFSSDLVFDGRKGAPYLEHDATAPQTVYGRSKALAEQAMLKAERGLMIRTAAFFSPHDPHNFAAAVVRDLSQGRVFQAAENVVVSPTYTPDLVEAALDLLIDGETGVRHLANLGAVSWADFARRIALAVGLNPDLVIARPAARAADTTLGAARGQIMPGLDAALARYADAVKPGLDSARVRNTPVRNVAEPLRFPAAKPREAQPVKAGGVLKS